jgi:hypothetical protein
MNKIIMLLGYLFICTIASSQTLTNGEYLIKVRSTGKFLAIAGASKDNGARLIQWDNEYTTHFMFIITNLGNGVYSIKAKHSGKYISTEGVPQRGANLIQWDWLNQNNQKWYITQQPGAKGYVLKCMQNNMKTVMQNWNASTDQPKNGSHLFLSDALPADMLLDFKKNETDQVEENKKPAGEIIKMKKKGNR